MSEVIDAELWRSAIRIAIPLMLAALGVLIAERSGVLNIGIEGCMLMGAAAGSVASLMLGSPVVGLLVGTAAGMTTALVVALFTVALPASQVAVGIAVNSTALGASLLLVGLAFGGASLTGATGSFASLPLPLLAEVPHLGVILFDQAAPTYVAAALVPAIWWFLFRSRSGIALRASGDSVGAARAIGLPLVRIRLAALIAGGALGGFGGAYLSVVQLSFFVENAVAGRGYIALALVVFGRWRPIRIAGAALLVGWLDALQLRLQGIYGSASFELLNALPYAAVLILLIVRPGRLLPPRELGRPWQQAEVR